MAKHKQSQAMSEIDQFLGFLYLDESAQIAQTSRDLESCGVNLARLEAGVAGILGASERVRKLGWLERARTKQADFEERLKARTTSLQRSLEESRALLQAMLDGQFGAGAQVHAQVFFRNRKPEEMSPRDLDSFLEDFELLKSMRAEDEEALGGSGRSDQPKPAGTFSRRGPFRRDPFRRR